MKVKPEDRIAVLVWEGERTVRMLPFVGVVRREWMVVRRRVVRRWGVEGGEGARRDLGVG